MEPSVTTETDIVHPRSGSRFTWYATAVALVVVSTVTILLAIEPTGLSVDLIAWGLLIAVIDLVPVQTRYGVQLLMDFPVLIALCILYPAPVAAMVMFVASLDPREFRREIGLARALFNRAQLAASALAAGALYHAVGPVAPEANTGVVGAGVAIVGAYAVNIGLVGVGAALLYERSVSRVFQQLTIGRPLDFLVNYLAFGLVGLAYAEVYRDSAIWAVMGLSIPLIFARQAFVRSVGSEGLRRELEEAYNLQGDRLQALQRMQNERADLSRVLTHDFLNAVSALRASAVMATRRWADLDEGQRIGWVRWIDRESGRITEMTEQVVTVMNLDAEKPVIAPQVIGALDLVREAADAVQELAGRLKVRIEPAATDALVLADASMALQVLRNLLTNAEKYSDPDTPIELRVDAQGREVLFVVRDRGEGIRPEEIALLFRRFSRLPSAIEKGVYGSGLGLYICRKIIDAHHGRLWAESQPGDGSIFCFTLPRWLAD